MSESNPIITRYDPQWFGSKPKLDKRPRWLLLGILAVGAKVFFSQEPALVEELYSQGFFQLIRLLFDNTVGRLGFPVLYLAIPYMLYKIAGVYIQSIRPRVGCIGRLFGFLYTTLAVLGWLTFWFMLLWGFNYNRQPIEDRIALQQMDFPAEYLKQQLQARAGELSPLRASIQPTDASIGEGSIPANMEDEVRRQVEGVMKGLGYRIGGKARGRQLFKGSLMRFGSSGVYFPYTGEANIDAALHPLEKPYTMAHEMAHSYGIADEGTCNFLAYLACSQSEDPFVRYSGRLMFWRSLAVGYQRTSPEADKDYDLYRAQLPLGIVRDLDDINNNHADYPDIMPKLRRLTYDRFLKAQGVKEGMGSYGRVVGMVLAWEYGK